jgi:hypothetical protein
VQRKDQTDKFGIVHHSTTFAVNDRAEAVRAFYIKELDEEWSFHDNEDPNLLNYVYKRFGEGNNKCVETTAVAIFLKPDKTTNLTNVEITWYEQCIGHY